MITKKSDVETAKLLFDMAAKSDGHEFGEMREIVDHPKGSIYMESQCLKCGEVFRVITSFGKCTGLPQPAA